MDRGRWRRMGKLHEGNPIKATGRIGRSLLAWDQRWLALLLGNRRHRRTNMAIGVVPSSMSRRDGNMTGECDVHLEAGKMGVQSMMKVFPEVVGHHCAGHLQHSHHLYSTSTAVDCRCRHGIMRATKWGRQSVVFSNHLFPLPFKLPSSFLQHQL